MYRICIEYIHTSSIKICATNRVNFVVAPVDLLLNGIIVGGDCVPYAGDIEHDVDENGSIKRDDTNVRPAHEQQYVDWPFIETIYETIN